MANPQPNWSDSPYAPKFSHSLYFQEKANFAGFLIGSILYGIVIVLFFKCIIALFNPDYRRGEPVKWGLVSYTVIMFSIVTILTGMQLDIQSISYIDYRAFPGIDGVASPGPLGYQSFIYSDAISVIPNFLYLLNAWLADGLLLYRCYLIFAKNFWVVAFPCLMYLGALAMGITMITYEALGPNGSIWNVVYKFALSYLSISVSLNGLLTLMIVTRLVLHTRDIRASMGISGIGGVCKATVTMLVESSALYVVNSVLVLGPWSVKNGASVLFLPILYETQVIAPLLIIQRVANRSAFAGGVVVSGGSSSADKRGGSSSDLEVAVETVIHFRRDKV